jgi:GT2 family glycosyltransferase
MSNRSVSVIVVNWNGKKWLKGCFDSLKNQTYKNFDVFMVDNGSSDDSVAYMAANYPTVNIVQQTENLGFSAGNNSALPYAKGELILLLSNDTTAPPDFIENYVKAFDEIPNLGSVQSKMRLLPEPELLDSCGSYWTNSTFLFHIGNGKDQSLERYNRSFPVFTNKGASMLIRRDVIDKVGLFDDEFWCYYEDTDFSHKVWIAGYECWYYPKAEMYHAGGGTALVFDNSYIQFHNLKNKLRSYLKNFSLGSLLWILPMYAALSVFLSGVWILQRKFKHAYVIYKSFYWNLVHLPGTLRERRKIQGFRKRSDAEIAKLVQRNPRLQYYQFLFSGRISEYED